MTKKTIHTFNSQSVGFSDKMFIWWDNIIYREFISSIKFSINMRNVFTKSFATFKTSITHEKVNKFFGVIVALNHSLRRCRRKCLSFSVLILFKYIKFTVFLKLFFSGNFYIIVTRKSCSCRE